VTPRGGNILQHWNQNDRGVFPFLLCISASVHHHLFIFFIACATVAAFSWLLVLSSACAFCVSYNNTPLQQTLVLFWLSGTSVSLACPVLPFSPTGCGLHSLDWFVSKQCTLCDLVKRMWSLSITGFHPVLQKAIESKENRAAESDNPSNSNSNPFCWVRVAAISLYHLFSKNGFSTQVVRNTRIRSERATNHTCVRVRVSKERRSWFGRGSGKIFSEREECCEQVFLRKGRERLLEKRRGSNRSLALQVHGGNHRSTDSKINFTKKVEQGIRKKETENLVRNSTELEWVTLFYFLKVSSVFFFAGFPFCVTYI